MFGQAKFYPEMSNLGYPIKSSFPSSAHTFSLGSLAHLATLLLQTSGALLLPLPSKLGASLKGRKREIHCNRTDFPKVIHIGIVDPI